MSLNHGVKAFSVVGRHLISAWERSEGGRDALGSAKNSSSSAWETQRVSLTSFGSGTNVGSRVRKRM